MEWIFSHLPLVVILVMAGSFLRTVMRAAKRSAQKTPSQTARAAQEDPDAAERTRRIQEEIRRKIAERRGATGRPGARPAARPAAQVPPPQPREMRPIDPFGGPTGRILRKLEEVARAQETPPPVPPPREEPPPTSAVLERQQQLADQMRALEEARQTQLRRAAETATRTAQDTQVADAARAARAQLLGDLRGAKSLRRAIVLREVLGTPVGLR